MQTGGAEYVAAVVPSFAEERARRFLAPQCQDLYVRGVLDEAALEALALPSNCGLERGARRPRDGVPRLSREDACYSGLREQCFWERPGRACWRERVEASRTEVKVSFRHQTVYNGCHKCAGRTFDKLLGHHTVSFETYRTLLAERPRMWHFLRFAVVRDPVQRFVSGYNQLLRDEETPFGRRHRDAESCTSREGRMAVARSLLRLMLEETVGFDGHLASQANELGNSASASLRLGAILKLEHLAREASVVLSQPGVHGRRLPLVASSGKGGGRCLLAGVEDLSDEAVLDVCRFYFQDFVCFGYPLPEACGSLQPLLDAYR